MKLEDYLLREQPPEKESDNLQDVMLRTAVAIANMNIRDLFDAHESEVTKLKKELSEEKNLKYEYLQRIESLENLCENYGVDIDEAEEI